MRSAKRAIGEVELDLGRYELRRSGRRVKLEKKPMELLIFLVGRREQMVSREDIVKKLWRSDLFIDTERNVNNIVRKIRAALGDDCDRTGLGGCAKTACPQRHIVDEIYEAQAVRAEQRHIVLARQ